MSLLPQRILQAAIPNPSTIDYVTPTGKNFIIKEIIFCNVSDSDTNVYMYLLPNGDTVETTKHNILSKTKVEARETWSALYTAMSLTSGDTLRFACDANSSVSVNVFAVEVL